MSLKYDKSLIPAAKELRKRQTRAQNHLWYDFLSKYPVRFQRKKTIGSHIADFYCHRARLVIMVSDSASHFAPTIPDGRDIFLNILEDFHLTCLFYTEKEVLMDFFRVTEEIDDYVRSVLEGYR